MKILRKIWGVIVWAVEKADIIPALVFVSAFHYAGALAWREPARDPALVAIVLGILIDLGQYRAVKAFLRKMERQRFVVVLCLTLMTGYYHWLWYDDILLAAMLPVLIIFLSLISKWEGWERQSARMTQTDTQPAERPALQPAPAQPPALPARAERRTWRSLTAADRAELKNMHADAIAEKYGIAERTAYEWIKKV